jgi:hypothetical protein
MSCLTVPPERVFTKSVEPKQHEVGQTPSRTTAGPRAIRELFRQHCVECHGAKGTGSTVRRSQPEIRDFTAAGWQSRRTDARLMSSILDSKGPDMPPQRGEISEGQEVRGLVDYVRSFARSGRSPNQEKLKRPAIDPTTRKPGQEEEEEPAPIESAELQPRRSCTTRSRPGRRGHSDAGPASPKVRTGTDSQDACSSPMRGHGD